MAMIISHPGDGDLLHLRPVQPTIGLMNVFSLRLKNKPIGLNKMNRQATVAITCQLMAFPR